MSDKKPSAIQSATAEADEALHAVLKCDHDLAEAKARIAQLDTESSNVLHLADSLDDRAALKATTQAKIAVTYEILEDLEAQRAAALAAFADARERLDLAKATKRYDRMSDCGGELAVHLAAAKKLMAEMQRTEKEMERHMPAPASKFKSFAEHLTAELFAGVIPGVAATRHPKALDFADLSEFHYGTAPTSGLEDQRKLSRHFSKLHWLLKKDTDPAAYAAGRDGLSKKKKTAA
ncbi:hypothetical protein [Tateyamaria sp.]|uniref:hypothetical protein n=1 Tax=Tateyamaria sp. TaxID=1929288 RepID=UPI00329E021D